MNKADEENGQKKILKNQQNGRLEKKNWHQMISNFLSQLEILSESGHQSYSNQI